MATDMDLTGVENAVARNRSVLEAGQGPHSTPAHPQRFPKLLLVPGFLHVADLLAGHWFLFYTLRERFSDYMRFLVVN